MSKRTRSRTGVQAKKKRARHERRARRHGEQLAEMVLIGMADAGPVPPYWPGRPNIHAERWWARRTGGRPKHGKGRRRLRGRGLRIHAAGLDGTAFFDVDHPLDRGGTFSNLLAPAPRWEDIKAGILEAAERFRLRDQERLVREVWPERTIRRDHVIQQWSREFLPPVERLYSAEEFRYRPPLAMMLSMTPLPQSMLHIYADPEPSRPRRYKVSALRTWIRRERRREWDEARAADRRDWMWHATEPGHDPWSCGRCLAGRRRQS